MEITNKQAANILRGELTRAEQDFYPYRRQAILKAIESLNCYTLTDQDFIEIADRFGDYAAWVVRDMVSGNNERWKADMRGEEDATQLQSNN
jgi:hypothetical protein